MKRGETILGWLVILFVWIACMISLSSCSRRAIGTTETSEVTDSTIIKYVPKEIIVRIPGDTVEIERIIDCDPSTLQPKPIDIRKRSGRVNTSVKIKSGKMTVIASCDSLKQIITALDKEVFHLRKEKKGKVEVVPFYKTRKIDVICRCWAGLCLIALIVYVVVKIKGGWLSGVVGFVRRLFTG